MTFNYKVFIYNLRIKDKNEMLALFSGLTVLKKVSKQPAILYFCSLPLVLIVFKGMKRISNSNI